jgi:plasmid stabilization system protein ParE
VPQASSIDVRRFHVDRIRYWVYYRVRGKRLEVVSVWHSSRGSGPAV